MSTPPPPTTNYTTAAKVSSFLRLRDEDGFRTEFSSTTDPTEDEVEDIILRSESTIDQLTHHAWRSTSVVDEMYDFEYARWGRHGYGAPFGYLREKSIKLRHRNIRGPFVDESDKIEVWMGGSYVNFITAKTEGRNADWWCDYSEGILYFVTSYPQRWRNAVRMTYLYGNETTVPGDIERLCTLMVACEIASSEGYSFIMPQGTADLKLGDRIRIWQEEIDKILARRTELIVVG